MTIALITTDHAHLYGQLRYRLIFNVSRKLRQLQEDNGFNDQQVYILRKRICKTPFSVMLQDDLFVELHFT